MSGDGSVPDEDVVVRARRAEGCGITGVVWAGDGSPSEAPVWSDGLLAIRCARSRTRRLRAHSLSSQMMEPGD